MRARRLYATNLNSSKTLQSGGVDLVCRLTRVRVLGGRRQRRTTPRVWRVSSCHLQTLVAFDDA